MNKNINQTQEEKQLSDSNKVNLGMSMNLKFNKNSDSDLTVDAEDEYLTGYIYCYDPKADIINSTRKYIYEQFKNDKNLNREKSEIYGYNTKNSFYR